MRVLIAPCLVIISIVAANKFDDVKKMYENPLARGMFVLLLFPSIYLLVSNVLLGFGDDINWVKWDDAIEAALDQQKPIFLLIHKQWCHACKGRKRLNTRLK